MAKMRKVITGTCPNCEVALVIRRDPDKVNTDEEFSISAVGSTPASSSRADDSTSDNEDNSQDEQTEDFGFNI